MSHVVFRPSPMSTAVLALMVAAGQAHAQAAAPADAPASQPEAETQKVLVRASADASAGGLPAPYAGGQVARGGRVGVLGTEDNMSTPFSMTNYTQKLVQDQQAASIADVLQNDPAVRVARGFGNFQQVYMVRGLPIYSDDMSYNGLYGLLPRQYLAAELVERVEVLRGASAFLNGAAPGGSGIGGAIDVMPKRAPDEALTEATVGVDSGGQGYAAVDVARRFLADKSLGLRLNAVDRDGRTSVDGQREKLRVLSLGLDYHTNDLRVSADIGYQDHRFIDTTPSITIASGLAIPRAPDASSRIAQPWTYSNERDTFGTLRAEYDITPAITGWAAGGFREGEEADVLATTTVTAADGSANVDGFTNTRKDDIGTGEVGLRAKLRTGPVGHTLVASYSMYDLDSKNAYGFANFAGESAGTIYAPVFLARPDLTYFTGGKLDDPLTTGRTITSSVALADTIAIWDDRLLLTVGARRQKIENSSDDYNTGVENAGADKKSRITPVAGLVFKVDPILSLYATYIEGLVAGDVAPATASIDGTTHAVANAGEVFAPYQSKQGELGAKVDFGRFGYTLSVFQTRKPAPAVDPTTFVYGDHDQQRNRGIEWSFFGEASPSLRVIGGISYLDTQLDGKQGIGAPKNQFNLGADWSVPGLVGLVLEGRGVHTGKEFADEANTQVLPSWNRFDLGARYTFDVDSKAITLRARVNNVTDRNYWASAGGYPGAGYLTLGSPRTLVVSGTVDF